MLLEGTGRRIHHDRALLHSIHESANQTKAEHTNELITNAVWFQPFSSLGNISHPFEWLALHITLVNHCWKIWGRVNLWEGWVEVSGRLEGPKLSNRP